MDQRVTVNNNVEDIKALTLGNLFAQDLTTANILPVYPSSFNENFRFKNKNKYQIFVISKSKASNDAKRFLVPLRYCCIAGNELPILVHKLPSKFLCDHWKRWLPEYPEPVIKTIEEGIREEHPLITLFPLEEIPEKKHAVNPEMHYHILGKAAIAETGAPYPKYFTEKDVVFPCMVKINQSLSGYGNLVAWNREELAEALQMIRNRFGAISYIISEFIQDVSSTLDCSFYVTKTGRIIWLAVQECDLEDYGFVGGTIDWDLQKNYKQRFYDSFVVPVARYLHKKGYFGIVGIDIVTSPSGDYLVDLNPRLNGNTQHTIMAASMARRGFSKSFLETCKVLDISGEELVTKANSINETNAGKVVILAFVDDDKKCYATVAVFGDSMEIVQSLYERL